MDFTLRYSRPWKDLTVGGEVLAGRDVFGESFSRLSGFVRYGGDSHTRDYDGGDEDDDAAPVSDEPHGVLHRRRRQREQGADRPG